MKLRAVTNIYKRHTRKLKKFMTTSCRKNVASLSFFQFIANLEQPRSQIPDVWSPKPTFSLKGTFHLIKTENRTKEILTQLSYYCFV